jgi:hypothetical protein
MSTRIERITVEIEIPVDGEPISETIAEVMGEMEDGIQRLGLTYRWAEDDGRWPELKKYLDANAAEREYEDYDVGTPERARLRARAETFALVRQHMAELEAE